MLVVKIEIWPHGNKDQKYTIDEMKIINTGDHPLRPFYGNYKIELGDKNTKVEYHDRRETVWNLVYKSIGALFKNIK